MSWKQDVEGMLQRVAEDMSRRDAQFAQLELKLAAMASEDKKEFLTFAEQVEQYHAAMDAKAAEDRWAGLTDVQRAHMESLEQESLVMEFLIDIEARREENLNALAMIRSGGQQVRKQVRVLARNTSRRGVRAAGKLGVPGHYGAKDKVDVATGRYV